MCNTPIKSWRKYCSRACMPVVAVTPEERSLIERMYGLGKSHQAIATAVCRSIGTVSDVVNRAIKAGRVESHRRTQ